MDDSIPIEAIKAAREILAALAARPEASKATSELRQGLSVAEAMMSGQSKLAVELSGSRALYEAPDGDEWRQDSQHWQMTIGPHAIELREYVNHASSLGAFQTDRRTYPSRHHDADALSIRWSILHELTHADIRIYASWT